MKIIERIASIIGAYKTSVRAFELKIGASNGMIGRAILKKTDISAEWLSKIIEVFPDVSSHWLLTGEGDMLRQNNSETANDQKVEPTIIYRDNPDKDEIIQLLRDKVKLLEQNASQTPPQLGFYAPRQSSESPVVADPTPIIPKPKQPHNDEINR